MKPELPGNPREEMELRVTALLLGELSTDEAAAIREVIAKDPELAKLHDDLKATIQLVQSAATKEVESVTAEAAQPKLSEARRKKLLTAFVIPPLKSKDRQPKWRLQFGPVEALAILAIVAALAAMFLPSVYFAKRPSAITALPGRRAEDELLAFTPMQTVDGGLAGGEALGFLPDQSVAGVPSPNAGGSADVVILSASRDPVARRIQASGQVKALSDDAGKDTTIAGRPKTVLSDYSKQAHRRLLTAESLPAAPPVEPAKSMAAIVLPSVAETDGDKLAAGTSVQQPQEAAVALSIREPQSLAAGDTLAESRLYRFSGGGAGGGGAGSAVAQGGAASFDTVDRVPVLGDLPMLGKLFRESETLKRDGAVLSDNFATSDFAVVPDSSVAKPQAWYDAKTTRGEKIDSLAIVDPSTGLPSLKLQEESLLGRSVAPSGNVAAEPAMRGVVVAGVEVARADSLGVNAGQFGAFAPQAQSLGFKEAVSGPPAQQSAPSYGSVLSPTPTAPAVVGAEYALMERYGIAAGEVKKGVAAQPADPARQLNESLADGLRSERGRTLVREGKELTQVGQEMEAAARFKAVTDANLGNQVTEERLALVNGTRNRDAVRSRGPASKDSLANVEVGTPLPRNAATNAPIPQPEIQTSENAFSTFSLNVSDVSFKLAMASLEQGQMPDAASVRSEEFINAFDYRDPEPAAGAPIAFAWERARYPFAHNRDLLRFSLKTAAAGRQAGRPLNVVLLLDNSGSMERADRVHIIREALRVLAAQLQPQDKLSVVTFARTPRLVADGIAGDKAGEVTEAVGELTPQGGTNLEEAMNLAYATAAKHYVASGINRVVMLTDGAANLGNVEPESLKQQVEAQRKQGIALDCFGIGWEGFNDDLLEVLSRNGDGRYGFINSPEEAATEFAGQLAGALKVAASDVKVQVEFNPKRVTSYRQIGYAKHQLTKEQFRDNTVDAAEIAAQEAGNALYTVEVNPAGEGPLATVRVRYKIPGTTDYREQAWDVPHSGAVAALEHSSPAMRLAASASAFAEWLVASPFAGEVTPDRLLGYLGGVPEVYGVDERPKKLEWMIRQAKSIEGK